MKKLYSLIAAVCLVAALTLSTAGGEMETGYAPTPTPTPAPTDPMPGGGQTGTASNDDGESGDPFMQAVINVLSDVLGLL